MSRRKMVMFAVIFVIVWKVMTQGALATDVFCQTGSDPAVNTALGCVPVKIDKFVEWLLPKLFGIAGGVSFLLMVYGFMVVATSSGDPKKVAGGQETVTSAIMGLLTSIFAIFILRLLAVGILKIPGF